MSLTKEDLMAISELMDKKLGFVDENFDGINKRFNEIDKRFDGIDRRLDAMDERLDGIEQSLDAVEDGLRTVQFKQEYTNKKLSNLQVDVDYLERNVRSDIGILQDEMETVVEVLRQNNILSY